MRDWFPLTNYEFYAFVASGMLLVAGIDYCFADAVLVNRTEWTVVQVIFWTVVSYIAGQICAAPSSGLIEFLLARVIFHSPTEIALGLEKRRWREHVAAWLFANREYSPLAPKVRDRIVAGAAVKLGLAVANLDGEHIFQVAFPAARASADTVTRLESFQNNYGFCRNICFVALLATGMLTYKYWEGSAQKDGWLAFGASAVAIGMYGRFLKYYAAYGRQVLTSYHHSLPT
ncbi:hypothetical protein HFO94_24710 [Rhizobium leguminosarum]|uniref:hypothetical protein n=1 Tax=Rhizobium leguminosarum TaxID=384 RepID=UPI001C94987C|nr:hypothetical protein [Rhizobium leguminosarum]MBY5356693.1 hypothetical protein [Rhizobium leguminosarum]